MNTAITFVDDPCSFRAPGAYAAVIPAGVNGKRALLHALKTALRLPDYFGYNWDALEECLRDLSWLPCGLVVLIHAELPSLPKRDLASYVGILEESMRSWEENESHGVRVIFPTDARSAVENARHAADND